MKLENNKNTANDFHGNFVDGFICCKCGFHTENVSRYEYDVDSEDISCYEYIFKYCPECGRKVINNY